MINYDSNYIYLTVPTEYKCVYYNILDVLGTLGKDLLSACTATCKGRAINGIACYNMFNAACAAYYLGQVKLARTLISYIKAQVEISCDNLLIFQDSSLDEFVYLKVPVVYQTVFENLLSKMAVWGQELLDDCTASCSGNNKNILNAWNLFQAAVTAYEYGNQVQSDKIVNFIAVSLGINSDTQPTTQYFTISINTTPSDAIVTINGNNTKTLTVEKNTFVTIIVSKSGYKSYTESFTAEENKTINVSLEREETPGGGGGGDDDNRNVVITVNPTPSDATVTINGNTGKTLSVLKGTPVNIAVRKTGYETNIVPQFTATSDVTINVTLPESRPQVTTATIAVVPTPSDATIKINGEVRNTIVLNIGESCTMEVSKAGYTTERKTITVEGDYTWIITLRQSNFGITPTNVRLAYTGGRVQFYAPENLQDGEIRMINNINNPSELKYYNRDTNEELQQDSLHGIDVAYFYTDVPQNNTNQAQTYRITAQNSKPEGDNEEIPIIIVVDPNPNATGRSMIILNVARDRSNNVVTGCTYYRNGVSLNNPPTEQQSYIEEFDSNPNSTEGITIVVKKTGYALTVLNIDFKNGTQEVTPIMDLQGDEQDFQVVPVKYDDISAYNLYNLNNDKYDLYAYDDGQRQQLMTAFVVECLAINNTSIPHVDVIASRQNDGGIETFYDVVLGSGRIIILIDPNVWSSEEITFNIHNSAGSEEFTVRVPAVI